MDEIDYKGVSEQLMYENERLRKRLVQHMSSAHFRPDWASLFNWIEKHAQLIILSCIVFGTGVAFFDTIQGRIRHARRRA